MPRTESRRIIREAQGRSDLLLDKKARLEDIQREVDGLKLKRRDIETSIEATIQTLRKRSSWCASRTSATVRTVAPLPTAWRCREAAPRARPPARQAWQRSGVSGPSRDTVADPGDDDSPAGATIEVRVIPRAGRPRCRLASGRATHRDRRSAGRRRRNDAHHPRGTAVARGGGAPQGDRAGGGGEGAREVRTGMAVWRAEAPRAKPHVSGSAGTCAPSACG